MANLYDDPSSAPDRLPPDFDFSRGEAPDRLPPDFDFSRGEAPDRLPPDFFENNPQPQMSGSMSAWRAAGGHAAAGIVPLIGGAIGGALGAGAGAVAGPVGAIGGGLAGAGAGSWLAEKGQDWVLDKLGLAPSVNQELSAEEQQHPYASEAGSLLDTLAAFGTGAGEAKLAERGVGAAVMGGVEAGQEYAHQGKFDPAKIAMSAAAGFALPKPRAWQAPFEAAGARLGGVAGRPDLSAEPTEGATKEDMEGTNDVTTTSPGIAAENTKAPSVAGAGNPVGAPMAAREAGSQPDYSKNAAAPASQDTAASSSLSTDPIHADVAAALTDANVPAETAGQPPAGVNAQQAVQAGAPPPPLNTGLAETERMNAEMQANAPHAAAATQLHGLDPLEASQAQRAALENIKAKQSAQQQGYAFNEFPVHPLVQKIVDSPVVKGAIQQAYERPIKTVEMPSGANSSKSLAGPVYVDPRVPPEFQRPVAVHETVEQVLMDKGIPYAKAHKIATVAEHHAVIQAGIPWEKYTHIWDGLLPTIEHEKPATLPPDLHVNPEAADANAGHSHHMGKAEILQKVLGGSAPKLPVGNEAAPVPEAAAAPVPEAAAAAPAEAAPVPPEAAPKPITMRDRALMANIRQHLASNLPDYVDKYDALPEAERLARAREIYRASRGSRGQRPRLDATAGAVRGVQADSQADAARKAGVLKAITDAVQAHPNPRPDFMPVSTPDRAELLQRLQRMHTAAVQNNGGMNPLDAYRPRVKPPEYQLLQAAQKVLKSKNVTTKNIKDYLATEKLLTGAGAPDAAKEIQALRRADSDIELRQRPQAEEVAATQPSDVSREAFEPIQGSGSGPTQEYVDAWNKAREWVNNLSPDHYATLAHEYDLRSELDEPADPEELLRDMQQTLAATTGKRPGILESGAEETTGRATPVRNAADLLTPAQRQQLAERNTAAPAASPVRSRKDLIDLYNQRLQTGDLAAPNREGLLEHAEAQQPPTQDRVPPEKRTVADFFKDETGAGRLPKWVQHAKNSGSIFSPQPLPEVEQLAETLGHRFQQYRGAVINIDRDIRTFAKATVNAFPEATKPAFYRNVYRSFEPDGEKVQLTARQQQYRAHLQQFDNKIQAAYDEMRERRPDLQLPAMQAGWIRHVLKGIQKWSPDTEAEDPMTAGARQSLSPDVSALTDRKFFELVSPVDNKRYLVSYDPEDGSLTRWQDGKATLIKNAQSPQPFHPGEVVTVNKQQYWIDHARTDEINQHARDVQTVNGQQTRTRIEYNQDPAYAMAEAYHQIATALERQKVIDHWLGNRFLNPPLPAHADAMRYMARSNSKLAREMGWKETKLPQMRGWAMAPHLRELVDTFVKPGFSAEGAEWAERANMRFTKLMFVSPFFHGYNVFRQWGQARGLRWLRPAAYFHMVQDMPRAMQSVSQQDYIQDRILKAGGTLELPPLLTRNVLRTTAEMFGHAVRQDTPKWLQMVDKPYDWSAKGMWWFNDVLLTHLFLEGTERMGLSDEAAVYRAHEMFPSYQAQTRLFNSPVFANLMNDRRLTIFGRYHGGLLKSFENLGRWAINGTPAEKKKAFGYIVGGAFTDIVLFGGLTAVAKLMTGDKDANVGSHGLATAPQAAYDALTGKAGDQSYTRALEDVLSVAPIPKAIMDLWANENWLHKPIIQPQDLAVLRSGVPLADRAKGLGRAGVSLSEYLAKELVSPVGQADTFAQRKGVGMGRSVADYFTGVHEPTPGTKRWEQNRAKYNAKDSHERTLHPLGVGEAAYDRFTGMR